jgi:DnaD/phage-associated family protein
MGASVIENVFINHYMPGANGEYVKVYIWGLKYALNSLEVNILDKDIAEALGLLESDVIKAWDYWQNEGIVRIINKSKEERIIQYLNIKSLLLSSKRIKSKDSQSAEQDKKRKQMFAQIEDMYRRPLSSKEMSNINAWIDEYMFTVQTVLLLIEDCVARNHTEMNYLNQVAQNWYDNNVRTYDEAIDYLSENKRKWERYSEIFKNLGFNRMPSKAEQKLIDGWFDTYGFDMAIISKALDTTVAVDKPSIKYIDSVLKDWYESGEVKDSQAKKTKRKQSKHKLSDEHEYDFEELEKRWLDKGTEEHENAD